jgi:WD40 repeat protein
VSSADPSYGVILEERLRDLDTRGGSPQSVAENLLGRQQLWWLRCQEAIREEPGWLFEHRSSAIRDWLIATAQNVSGHAAGSVRWAVDSAYLIAQSLSGKLDRQEDAGRLAQVARQWDQSGLLLPPLGTGLISATGAPTDETRLASGITQVITALSAQAGDLRGVSEPARAMVAVTALLLAGAESLDRHSEKVAVVFGQADDHGQSLGRDSGVSGFLELCEFPAGPAGLFPDPRSMAGARAVNPEFADALAIAWRYCRGDRCVLWRIVLPDDPMWIPVMKGNSLGAAFTLGLLELLRNRRSRHPALASVRRVIYRLRPGTAVTGHIDDQGGLHWVGDMEEKLRAAHRKRWLLIAPQENQKDLGQAPDPRLVKPAATIMQASRYAHQWRAGRLATATALTVALAITATLLIRANTQVAQANTQAGYQHDVAISENLARTSGTIDSTNPVLARLLAVTAWRLGQSGPAASQAQQAMLDAAALPTIRLFDSTLGPIESMAFSPDGKVVAVDTGKGRVWLWNPATGQPIRTLPAVNVHLGTSVAFSPDGKILASGGDDGTDGEVQIWNAATGQPIRTLFAGHVNVDSALIVNSVTSVAFSPDGETLAVGTTDGQIKLWNTATWALIHVLSSDNLNAPATNFSDTAFSLAFSPDGEIVAAGSNDGDVRFWNAATSQLIRTLPGNSSTGAVQSVAFSPDGKTLADGETGGTRLWNVATGKPAVTLPTDSPSSQVYSVAFSPDGGTLAVDSSGNGTQIQLWDTATDEPISTPLSAGPIDVVAFSPDGKTLASGSDDGEVRLWRTDAIQSIRTIPTVSHSGPIGPIALSPDGRTLATGNQDGEGENGEVQLWNAITGQLISTKLADPYDGVDSVVFSPDGKILASGDGDSIIGLWNAATGQPIRSLPVSPTGPVLSMAFSPDGKILASGGSENGQVQLWNAATWQRIGHLAASSQVFALAFSPDGKTLATGTANGEVQLWNTATWAPVGAPLTTTIPEAMVSAIAFSPDGKTLAVTLGGNQVQLWNTATGQQDNTLTASPSDRIGTVTFSPNGTVLASGSENGQVQLWDTTTSQPIGILPANSTSPVGQVVFSPDGETLAADSGGSTQFWNVGYLENVASYLCTLAGRSLTHEEWTQYVPSGPAYMSVCP